MSFGMKCSKYQEIESPVNVRQKLSEILKIFFQKFDFLSTSHPPDFWNLGYLFFFGRKKIWLLFFCEKLWKKSKPIWMSVSVVLILKESNTFWSPSIPISLFPDLGKNIFQKNLKYFLEKLKELIDNSRRKQLSCFRKLAKYSQLSFVKSLLSVVFKKEILRKPKKLRKKN